MELNNHQIIAIHQDFQTIMARSPALSWAIRGRIQEFEKLYGQKVIALTTKIKKLQDEYFAFDENKQPIIIMEGDRQYPKMAEGKDFAEYSKKVDEIMNHTSNLVLA